jgi:hypothetical protein
MPIKKILTTKKKAEQKLQDTGRTIAKNTKKLAAHVKKTGFKPMNDKGIYQ